MSPAGSDAERSAVAITADVELPRALGTKPDEVLLAALARALCAWSDAEGVRIDLEQHGRVPVDPAVDVSRTVGWFTTLVPVYLPAGLESTPEQAIEQVRELVGGLPHEGLGYGLLAYGESADPAVAALGPAEVVFSYIGSTSGRADDSDRLLRRSAEPSGQAQALENARPYVLDVTCRRLGDRVQLVWTYRQDQFRADQIQQGLALFVAELDRLLGVTGTN